MAYYVLSCYRSETSSGPYWSRAYNTKKAAMREYLALLKAGTVARLRYYPS